MNKIKLFTPDSGMPEEFEAERFDLKSGGALSFHTATEEITTTVPFLIRRRIEEKKPEAKAHAQAAGAPPYTSSTWG
jgi:hypothetical protein